MENVATLAQRRPESVGTGGAVATADAARTLIVTATYLLSEDGRKASLLAGGDGHEVQQLAIDVPANRLHLVSVDANGVARLKLRPRYQLDEHERVVRIDAAPVYDVPPDIEDLFREAARNHQLERTYETERRDTKTKRRDAQRERKAQLAQAFLADPAQRAIVHPPPTPWSCHLATPQGRLPFDAKTDPVPARDVPGEAHRRFRTDLRMRREQNLQQRAQQLALHEEKKRFIAEWIAAHGTPDQQARQTAGVLPMEEAIDAMTDDAFSALADRPLYQRDGAERLQQHLQAVHQYVDTVVAREDLLVTSTNAEKMTAAQWALVRQLQAAVTGATVTLRLHELAWKRAPQAPHLTLFAILLTRKVGPFTLRREYAAPGGNA